MLQYGVKCNANAILVMFGLVEIEKMGKKGVKMG